MFLVIVLYAVSVLFMAGLAWGLDEPQGYFESAGYVVLALVWPMTLVAIAMVLLVVGVFVGVFVAGYKVGEWLNSPLYGVAK